jgi:lipopolysaccharide transport system permease protein
MNQDCQPPAEAFDLVIEAGRASGRYWRDLWHYRELLYFLAWRDLLVRYKQTAVGVAWALLRPLLTLGVFTVVFGRLAGLPSEGAAPYPLLVLAGLLPWQFFANALGESGGSLLANANLITKVYFPRLLVPASAVAVSCVDFLITGLLLLGLMLWYGYWPTWRLLALGWFAALAFAAALGAGLWTAALTVKYRDFRHVTPFLMQLGLYLSPVGFSSRIVPDAWRPFYGLNPLVGIINGFRWAIHGGETAVDWLSQGQAVIVVAGLVGSGVWYFRRTERTFADVI